MKPSTYQHAVAALTRLYPFYSGAASLPNRLFFKRISGLSGEAWAKTPGGEVYAKLNDFVGRAAFFCGDIDPKLTWVARRVLRPGDTAFDIGANIGIMTLLFSRIVGPSGSVHAFEPNPVVMRALHRAVTRSGAPNVILNELAVGSEKTTLTLRVAEGNDGSGSLARSHEWGSTHTHEVAVTTIDDYVGQHQIKSIGLMKIDIEGFELELFKGGSDLLKKIQPRAIVFEDNAAPPDTASPVIDFLRSHDYELLSLPKALLRMTARKFSSNDTAGGHDFVAAKRGRPFDDLCRLLT
jgi:FkbM family methyltransferase